MNLTILQISQIILTYCCVFISFSGFADTCKARQYHSQVEISQVIDGDTFRLTSGQSVRLIGINTPEINHKNLADSEPLAREAKAYLSELIINDKVNLVLDSELVDKYNRMLAHVFNTKGENLQQALIAKGYADARVYGDNKKYWRCYFNTELKARNQHLGIWQHKKWKATLANKARAKINFDKAWFGYVSRVFRKDTTTWMVLENHLYVGISDLESDLFLKHFNFDQLVGKNVIVETKVAYKDKKWRGELRDIWQLFTPSQLSLLEKTPELIYTK
ncbi:thermonuclease family protein [Catenovulum maritimum]|uniref:thermonuclease family protein n=1 Tax=Catenovulum maritimum TaxID=1513271 RepID=UPI00066137FD|nr:thermonuclease family protein [Catenovulum maritimum]